MNYENTYQTHTYKRISWSAVLAGAFVTVGLSFLLNLFALAIGLSTFTVAENGAKTLAVGGLIAMFIGVIVTMLLGGYAAGYLGRHCSPRRNLGILYGFTSWTLALLLAAAVASPIAHYATIYSEKVTGSAINMSDYDHKAWGPTSDDNQPVARESVPAAKALTSGAFILFVLFLVGGIASCIGGCWGMSCKRED